MNIRNYNHSRPLDVHLSSNHPEVNNFINAIYDQHFNSPTTNQRIVKKHLKTVLLDLYVAWHKDPNLNISVHMSPNAYSDGTVFSKGKGRYNHLNIKRTIIDVIHKLVEVGLIGFKSGFEGRLSRIWCSDPLIEYFKKALFDEFDIGYSEDREVIILKDEDKVEIEYKDTATTNEMRTVVQQYNALLRESFIDIPTLETPVIPYKDQLISMGQHDKFVRRIFNNNSFEEGGRFAGGWWHRYYCLLCYSFIGFY